MRHSQCSRAATGSEVMLQLLEDEREVILDKVRRSPLPTLVRSEVAQISSRRIMNTLSGFPLSVLRPSNCHLCKSGNNRKE